MPILFFLILDISGVEPGDDWPQRGEVKIRNVAVRYAEKLPPVLKGISLYVRPGEKVMISFNCK